MEASKETPAFAPVAPKDQWTRNSPGKIFGPPVRTFLRDPSDRAERFHLTSHCVATPTTGCYRWHLRGRTKPNAQLGRKAVVSSPNAAVVLCTSRSSSAQRALILRAGNRLTSFCGVRDAVRRGYAKFCHRPRRAMTSVCVGGAGHFQQAAR